MYEYISGRLVSKRNEMLVIDCGGIGYQLHVPSSTIGRLPQIGERVKLLTHFHSNDRGLHQLFGFSTEAERDIFLSLKGVTKVGPKLALAILSAIPADQFPDILAGEDVKRLTSVPGVGKKTAQQIVLDLKNKLPQLVEEAETPRVADEAVLALESLGYSRYEVRKILDKLTERHGQDRISEMETEDLIREALQIA